VEVVPYGVDVGWATRWSLVEKLRRDEGVSEVRDLEK